ncbi:mite allergen Der f 3-like [Chironomus tepperi]|uniref:mite allergen Der f 3-like n=1 Tax=Chironomus tepperi TaxID=113505 RepID=UPI00391F4F45
MESVLKYFLVCLVFQVNQLNGIYYAEKAIKNQFPYTVLIRDFLSFCTGALISDRHVLTAAHCLRDLRKGSKIKVEVGYFERSRRGGMSFHSDKYWMHENFIMPSAVYDIGLIELPVALDYSKNIQWLKLSTKQNAELDLDDQEVEIAGWGDTEYSTGISSRLLYTNMTLITMDECEKYKSHYVEDFNENHICAVKVKGSPCSGDSGAAMVSMKTKKILGVLSYGKDAENGIDLGYNDCHANVPVVFTRISSYIDWINEKTGLNFS